MDAYFDMSERRSTDGRHDLFLQSRKPRHRLVDPGLRPWTSLGPRLMSLHRAEPEFRFRCLYLLKIGLSQHPIRVPLKGGIDTSLSVSSVLPNTRGNYGQASSHSSPSRRLYSSTTVSSSRLPSEPLSYSYHFWGPRLVCRAILPVAPPSQC